MTLGGAFLSVASLVPGWGRVIAMGLPQTIRPPPQSPRPISSSGQFLCNANIFGRIQGILGPALFKSHIPFHEKLLNNSHTSPLPRETTSEDEQPDPSVDGDKGELAGGATRRLHIVQQICHSRHIDRPRNLAYPILRKPTLKTQCLR